MRPTGAGRTLRAATAARLATLALAALLAGCGGWDGGDPIGPEDWVNPDLGSLSEPVGLHASDLPYTGTVTEGINYFRITGLDADTPRYVAVLGKRADADLFVLGDSTFSDYQCSSTVGGAADDMCLTLPFSGDALYVQVYGFAGTDTVFILDVW